MTRINCVPVKELTNKHLLAEYRELPRLFKLAKPVSDAPTAYKLGSGHVKFFYDKGLYLVNRYNELIDELESRGFNLNEEMYNNILKHAETLPAELMNNYTPTLEAMALNRQRIKERLNK